MQEKLSQQNPMSVDAEHNKASFAEAIRQHAGTVRKIIDEGIALGSESNPIHYLVEGKIDSVSYRVVFRSGKQQPVLILQLSFPSSVSGEVVFRQAYDLDRIEGFYQLPAVRKIFPELFLSYKGVLVLECIQGLEEKRSGTEFSDSIQVPARFIQLVDDSFIMIDALLESGLSLQDIAPAAGHNIIYDVNSLRYRFFDVDSLAYQQHATKVEEFFDIVNSSVHLGMDKKSTQFWLMLIKKFREKYPSTTVYREGGARLVLKVDRLESSDRPGNRPSENIVMPTDERYESYYQAVDWRGPYSQGSDKEQWIPLHTIARMQVGVEYIDEGFLAACDGGDFEVATQILEKNNWRIILTKEYTVGGEGDKP